MGAGEGGGKAVAHSRLPQTWVSIFPSVRAVDVEAADPRFELLLVWLCLTQAFHFQEECPKHYTFTHTLHVLCRKYTIL